MAWSFLEVLRPRSVAVSGEASQENTKPVPRVPVEPGQLKTMRMGKLVLYGPGLNVTKPWPAAPGNGMNPNNLVIRQQYDEQRFGLFSFRGTASEMVFTSIQFWLPTLLHWILIIIADNYKPCPEGTDYKKSKALFGSNGCEPVKAFLFGSWVLAGSSHGAITGLCQFLTVFYATACFARYTDMYVKSIGIQGKMHNVSVYLRIYFTKKTTRWNVLRYLLSVHALHYWTLRSRRWTWGKTTDPSDNPGDIHEFCQSLVEQQLLIDKEAELLAVYSGDRGKLLFTWAIIALKKIMETNLPAGEKGNSMLFNEHEQTALVQNVKDEICAMRAELGGVNNALLFPFPWPYFHVVKLISNIQLLFLAISMLKLNTLPGGVIKCRLVSCVTLPMICYVFVAIISVASSMSDPFGEDWCDFNKECLHRMIVTDCKALCDEPEEPFLSFLGDPKFNPKRGNDGQLIEVDPNEPKDEEDEMTNPVLIPQSEVQLILDEKAELENELRIGGVSKLAECLRELTETVKKVIENQKTARQGQVMHSSVISNLGQQLKQQTLDYHRIATISAQQMDRITRLETMQAAEELPSAAH